MASNIKGEVSSDRLRSLCECPVCFEPYKDPRLLKCGHQFCEHCLLGIIQQSPQNEITCPVCREVTKPKHGDVKTLPRATLLQHIQEVVFHQPSEGDAGQKCSKCRTKQPTRHCPECSEDLAYLCDQCFAVHQKIKRFATHATVKYDQNLICPDHPLKQVENFCHTCGKATCVECMFSGHGDHNTEPLDELVEKCKQRVQAFISTTPEKQLIDEAAVAEIKKRIGDEKKQQISAFKEAVTAAENLVTLLRKMEDRVVHEMDQALSEVSTYQAKVADILTSKNRMNNLAKVLLGDDISDIQLILGSKDLHELPPIDKKQIYVPNVLEEIKQIAGKIQDVAAHLDIIRKQDSRIWYLNVLDIKCTSNIQGCCFDKITGNIIVRDNDQQHQIKIYSQSGLLQEKLDTKAFGLSLFDGLRFNTYSSIAIDSRRHLYLCPNNDGTFVRLDMKGRLKDKTKLGDNLSGVCYINRLDMYAITDFGLRHGEVKLVSAKNMNIARRLFGKFSAPHHVCTGIIHGNQTIVVSDWHQTSIFLYDLSGTRLKTIKCVSGGKSFHPTGVAIDNSGKIITCDMVNKRIVCVSDNVKCDQWNTLIDRSQLGGMHPWSIDIDNDNYRIAYSFALGSKCLKLCTCTL